MRMELGNNHNNTQQNTVNSSRSNSHASSNSELEKEFNYLEINSNNSTSDGNLIKNGIVVMTTTPSSKSSSSSPSPIITSTTTTPKITTTATTSVVTSISTTLTSTTTPTATVTTTSTTVNNLVNKKRISNSTNSRTPTRKAKRVRFYRNGDRFYSGITIPVSYERYRSFESLAEDLTRLLEENVKIPGAVRNIYTLSGKKVSNLDDLEDGQSYVCSCNNENFKKIEYNNAQQQQQQQQSQPQQQQQQNQNNSSTKTMKNRQAKNSITKNCTNGSPVLKLNERDSVVFPRIVTLIRNGTKPRKIMRLLLNKRNSPTFDHVLTAITQVVKLDTGCVRKVYTLSGQPVLRLDEFFNQDDVFFAYGTERVNLDDFKLETDELKIIQQTRKSLKNTIAKNGPIPKMPIKSTKANKLLNANNYVEASLNEHGIYIKDIPKIIYDQYNIGYVIGDGNFAKVLKCQNKETNKNYALKIIDKSKCKDKEHYIDAEVRVMKKLNHPHIISLILDVDQSNNMYLLLEYIGGGDLFDAIIRVTKFSEDQSRIMIKHLASAMAYLHSMRIVHRDIKPENLLVELDDKGNVLVLKLADFGLACEVTDEPLMTVCGTPTYVAPEILMETGYGLKIDVWAAGIILYILLCGFPPFVSPDNQQEPLFDAILSGIYEFPEPYWTDISEGVRDLISNMLQSDPNVRFSSEDILDHYWTLGDTTYEYNS